MPNVYVVSLETQLFNQLEHAFPELNLHFNVVGDPGRMTSEELSENWQAVILDMDAFGKNESLVPAIEKAMKHVRHVILLVPGSLLPLPPEFSQAGVYLLHKPTSTGEIGLVLSRILRQS